MRIAIVNITGGGMSGGYKAYLKGILPRLARHPEVEEVLCAAPAGLKISELFPEVENVQFIPCAPFRFFRHTPDASLTGAIQEFSPDVIFIPVERYLDFGSTPLVTMVQNMGPLAPVDGNPISERLRYAAQRYEAKIAAKNATHVIAPTTFVRDFLTRRWQIPETRVQVIHYGSDRPDPKSGFQRPSCVPEEWKGRFLLTVGSIEPYRGLEDVVKAMDTLQANKEIRGLVVAGYARRNMTRHKRTLERSIERRKLTKRVIWTGQLDKTELSWCYSNCSIFIMTSRVESFAMVGIEALAHGCISVVADNPPLPEIFGQAAQYYTRYDGGHLARVISEVLGWNQIKFEQASINARRRADTFSWDTMVQKTVQACKYTIAAIVGH